MQYFSDSVLNTVKKAANRAGSIRKLADALDMNGNTISRWLTGERSPSLLEVAKVIEYVGAQLSMPGEAPDATSAPQLTPLECQNCEALKEEIKRLTFKIEGMVELASAQAAAQSKVEIDQRPQLQALAKGQAS